MKKVGLIGYRGMVGSVLIERMIANNDFAKIIPFFFSTSSIGDTTVINNQKYTLLDANSIAELSQMDILISTQGSDYTNSIYYKIREYGWDGYWIDAASALRMNDDTCIPLDPVNKNHIQNAIKKGIKTFAGGNCSITLAMIGLNGLLQNNLIEWLSIMTFQSASGAGAKNVRELLLQNKVVADNIESNITDKNTSILEIMHQATQTLHSEQMPIDNFGINLSNNIIPWIDNDLGNGTSKEEWKSEIELNKILNLDPSTIKVDGFCVRVPAIRCHSTAITMQLKKELSIDQVQNIIAENQPWIKYIHNNKSDTIKYFTPASITNSLYVHVGRLKKLSIGENIFGLMTIGDQLLWGAAEPLRCMLNLLI